MFKYLKGFALPFAALLVMTVASGAAKADTVTFQLNTGSTMPSINYGTLTLTLVGNNINVAINLTTSGAKIVNTGFPASVAFNFNGASNPNLTITGLPGTYSAVNSGVASDLHMDGFGHFEYGVLFGAQGGGNGTDSTLSFTVGRAGGFSSVFELVENSINGSIASPFGVDVIYQGATGVIGTRQSTTPTPEPASMFLLGSGLVGVAAGLRRRRNRKA